MEDVAFHVTISGADNACPDNLVKDDRAKSIGMSLIRKQESEWRSPEGNPFSAVTPMTA
jgi:hypothetical protein